jgi:WD40 repeat protein
MSDSLLIDQRRRWEQGDCVPVESYLAERPDLRADADQILELIEHEITLREERGETPELEEYLRRFPNLSRDLRLHFEVHAALHAEAGATYIFPRPHPEADGPARGERPTVPGYEVLEELGRGGMGVVYKARQLALNRVVALKMILAGPHAGPQEVARFRREAEAVAQLVHAHIVQIYDVGECAGRPYLALEYVDGGSLDQRTMHTPQAPEAAARLVETLAAAMHCAHQRGIIHRDLKPANVLLAGSDSSQTIVLGRSPTDVGRYEPKISDFGLAKLLDAGSVGPTRSGDIVGTPCYMAPEQAEGKSGAIGPATDIWALGAMLYELLTGRPPFQAASALETLIQVRHQDPVSPSRLQPRLPRDLVTICLTCLNKEPRKRYASAQALAEDLHRFLEGKPIRARPTNAVERTVKWVRRRPAVAALLAAIVAVTVLGFAAVAWKWREAEANRAEAEAALRESNRRHYQSLIARAQHELNANHFDRARALLREANEKARGWEYDYLKRMCELNNLFVLRGNGAPVQAVAYSPDGHLLAAGSGDWYTGKAGELSVWNAHTGERLWSLSGDLRTVYGVAFDPHSRRLASACADGKVRIHDAQTGRLLWERPGHRSFVNCVAFSPDGRQLASGSRDKTVCLWDVATGKHIRTFRNHTREVWSVAFSPKGQRLASGDFTGTVHIWDPQTGMVFRSFGGFDDCRAVAFSPDGTWLALAYFSYEIVLWDLIDRNAGPIVRFSNAGPILSLAFMPNGCLLWSSRQGSIKIQDLRTGRHRYTFQGHEGWAYAVAASPDCRRVATAGKDGTVRIHDATAYADPQMRVTDGTVRIHDATVRANLWMQLPDAAEVPGLQFDPKDDRLLALGGRRGEVTVWDAVKWHERRPLLWLPRRTNPTAMAGSPDGRFWAWVEGNKLFVRERRAPVDVDAWPPKLVVGPVTGLAFSGDSRLLAWGDADGVVRWCDAATGRDLDQLGPHAKAVTGVSFHPNGRHIASVDRDGTFRVWDLGSREEVTRFGKSRPDEEPTPGQPANVTRIAYSPDGRRLAVANPRRPLELWDVETGQIAMILALDRDSQEGCSSATWSADGKRLAAAFGFRVRIWDATERSPEERRQATEGDALAWHQQELIWANQRWDWFAAAYHLGKVIETQPSHAGHYAQRAGFRACLAEDSRGRWGAAAADMAMAVFLSPDDARQWYYLAMLTLATGDRVGYRAVCEIMLARFGRTNQALVVHNVAWACSLGPEAVADPSRVVALVRRVLDQQPGNMYCQNALGVALYRAGDFHGAREWLGKAVQVRPPEEKAWYWLFLAMTHHQLSEPKEARRWLDQAAQAHHHTAVDRPPPGTAKVLVWHERLGLRLLREQATSLLHPKRSSGAVWTP